MKHKKVLLAALLVFGMLIASCAPTATPTAAPAVPTAVPTAAPKLITAKVGVQTDWATLAPFAAVNIGRLYVNTSIYERLFTPVTFGGELVGVIGKSYKDVGSNVYRVNIYDYVHDTDGNPVTASDVKFSYDKAKASGFFPDLSVVQEIKVIDKSTMDFYFNTFEESTLGDTFNSVDIVSQKAYEASADQMATKPVGTNYKVTEYVSGSSVTLQDTGKYWQTDAKLVHPQSKSNPDMIIYKVIQDPAQMAIALETGEIDIASSVAGNEINRFMDNAGKAKAGYTIAPRLSNVTHILYFNVSKGNPFTNKDLRKAVLYAIDNKALVAGVLSGKGEPCVTFGGSVFGQFQTKWLSEDYYNLNLDKARAALTASGVKVADLKIRIMTSANPNLVKAAQIIQAELLEIGIKSEVLSYEEALFQSYLYEKNQWDIQLNMKGKGPTLANLWGYCFDNRQYKGETQNFVVDPKLQTMVEGLLKTGGATDANVDAFHQYLKEEAYVYGLWNPNSYAAAKSTVTKVSYSEKPFVLAGGCEFSPNFGK